MMIWDDTPLESGDSYAERGIKAWLRRLLGVPSFGALEHRLYYERLSIDGAALIRSRQVKRLRRRVSRLMKLHEPGNSPTWKHCLDSQLDAVPEFAQVVKERDELQAKCAEMRDSLRRVSERSWFQDKMQKEHEHVKHALSGDCGRGWVRVEELKPTVELLKNTKGV